MVDENHMEADCNDDDDDDDGDDDDDDDNHDNKKHYDDRDVGDLNINDTNRRNDETKVKMYVKR